MSGAKYRLSALMSALGLILIILLFSNIISLIPLAGLIGVMLIVSFETGEWSALNTSNGPVLISLLATIIVSLTSHNLAFGVIAGTLIHYLTRKDNVN
jgi:SulP family sulfate permease